MSVNTSWKTIQLDDTYVPGDYSARGCSMVVSIPYQMPKLFSRKSSRELVEVGGVPQACRMPALLHKNARMLIVDDNQKIQAALSQRFLSMTEDWMIHTAENGETALEAGGDVADLVVSALLFDVLPHELGVDEADEAVDAEVVGEGGVLDEGADDGRRVGEPGTLDEEQVEVVLALAQQDLARELADDHRDGLGSVEN